MADTTQKLILDLLTAAAIAHGTHEKEELGGQYDEQWPDWYAEHMAHALRDKGFQITTIPNENDDESA